MKIICIARNYVAHADEMNVKIPESPAFFMKPESSLLINNKPFYYPDFTKELHYEAEIVVKINRNGKYIQKKFARKYYSEIAFGIDLTARDLQRSCKEKGLPWDIAKSFEYSAPISYFIELNELDLKIDNVPFRLDLNGNTVQKANTAEMIFHVDELIEFISRYMTLKIGDLIFTGTPQGVGPLAIGDTLEGYIADKKMISFKIK